MKNWYYLHAKKNSKKNNATSERNNNPNINKNIVLHQEANKMSRNGRGSHYIDVNAYKKWLLISESFASAQQDPDYFYTWIDPRSFVTKAPNYFNKNNQNLVLEFIKQPADPSGTSASAPNIDLGNLGNTFQEIDDSPNEIPLLPTYYLQIAAQYTGVESNYYANMDIYHHFILKITEKETGKVIDHVHRKMVVSWYDSSGFGDVSSSCRSDISLSPNIKNPLLLEVFTQCFITQEVMQQEVRRWEDPSTSTHSQELKIITPYMK